MDIVYYWIIPIATGVIGFVAGGYAGFFVANRFLGRVIRHTLIELGRAGMIKQTSGLTDRMVRNKY